MNPERAFFLNAGAAGNNREQIEAHLAAKITPFLDLLFNRTPAKLPPLPAEFRGDLEQLDADIARGELGRHFHIDTARKQITPRTDAANHLLIFADMVKDEPAIAKYLNGEGGTGCEQ